MSGWGQSRPERRTILECPMAGCGHALIGTANLMSARFCPTHNIALVSSLWTRVEVPQPAKEKR